MTAIICLVVPSLIVFLVKELLWHNSAKISEKAQEYAGYLVVTNILMIFILFVGFNNYGQLISKLNNSYVFALKYFSLSFVLSILIALLGRAEYKQPNLKQKVKTAVPYICLIALFIAAGVLLDRNVDLMLDSDMSSEMILAKLLSQEKGALSTEWFYSTELRVLNTQLVFTPLFGLFSNWHVIRVIGSIICWIILLLSYYYFCKQLGQKQSFAISALCLLLPISYIYFTLLGSGDLSHPESI